MSGWRSGSGRRPNLVADAIADPATLEGPSRARRQLGFLAWGLPATDDPYDLLYRSITNEIDLERVSDHL